MLEKQRSRQGEPVRWENTGPFEQSVFGISIHETRIDIPRLIVAILAINFLPAVALWRYDQLCEWLRGHKGKIGFWLRGDKSKIGLFAYVLAWILGVFFLFWLAAMDDQKRRVDQTPSLPISIKLVSPSPASAAPVKSPSSGFVDATPTPVRRAIPVSE